ncbi:uncharacterized protein LOC127276820 [Leptopilina boulardi]|uniref:uncharacterized protein LOC127276820 n=1 Tax=Leptopilina boulardi TaxID=63433 RepID=UPI0021F53269|nr:uncharacterized protein LOC127276820 [Leptopilina boulardi]
MNLIGLMNSFFKRISKDFRHKELLPLKLAFFVKASTLSVLYPYLTIHMRELGINVQETALMSAITPLAVIIMPPLAGLIADRIGNFRISLALLTSVGGLAALLLLLVPVGRVNLEYPDRIILDAKCQRNSDRLIFEINQTYPCEEKLESEINMRIESCGFMCSVPNNTDVPLLLQEKSYTIEVAEYDSIMLFNYSIPERKINKVDDDLDDVRSHRMLKNDEFFKTSIRQITNYTLFFPANDLYSFKCIITEEEPVSQDAKKILKCGFGHISNKQEGENTYEPFKVNLKTLNESTDSSVIKTKYLVEKSNWTDNNMMNVECENGERTYQKFFISAGKYNIMNCHQRCLITAPRSEICSNMKEEVVYNIQLTFWLYLSFRLFNAMIGGTAWAMFEGAVIATLREHKADYGLQRLYGSLGGMISSPLSGLMIDSFSKGKAFTDFRPAFYLYAALKVASGVLMLFISLEFKSPAKNIFKDVYEVLKNVEIVTLYVVSFMLGTAWGYIESFLFWFLQDLGASQSLMGITITVSGLAGLPLLVVSGPIIHKLGHANVLFIGFIFYAIRLVGYSLIYNPWLCLIFEALESVTSGLAFTAAVTYAAKLSTTATDSTVQGLLGGIYYGVGKSCGGLVGGFLMKGVGTRPTYQIFALASLLTGLMYYVFNVTYLKKRPQVEGNDIVKKEPKKKKTTGQNDLENGSVEIVSKGEEEKKKKKKKTTTKQHQQIPDKEKIAQGYDNKAYSKDAMKIESANPTSKDIEALNNVKNLDKIEKISESGDDHEEIEKNHDKKEDYQKDNNTIINSTTDDKSPRKCSVTIEKVPKDK